MDVISLLGLTNQVKNAPATNKDRKQKYNEHIPYSSPSEEELSAGSELNEKNITDDRRNNDDRRQSDIEKPRRLECRNKNDRRASRLNIKI